MTNERVFSWARAIAIGTSLLSASTVWADVAPVPPPATTQVSASDAKAIKAFFDGLIDGMIADKADCKKMAKDISARIDQNLALLKKLMANEKANIKLPPDVEKAINDRMTAVMPQLEVCVGDPGVQAAMMRMFTPDAPAPVTPVSFPEVKAPVAQDLALYTKGLKGKGDLIATIKTSEGTIKCQLLPDKAPLAVANFVGLATGKKPWLDPKTQKLMKNKPFYNGLTFHRVVPDFMIQGGDPMGTGIGGPGYEFANETSDLKMTPGTLAMANAGPNTNGSQFFITDGSPTYLDGGYSIFGTCTPIDIVKKIETVPTVPADRPAKDVTMKITIARGTL